MKTVAALAAAASAASAMTLDADVHLFQQWKLTHGKRYESDEHELAKYNTFKTNAAYINEHNMKEKSFTLALNQFADMTHDEYKAMLLGSGPRPNASTGSTYLEASNVVLPTEVDWRTKGYVTGIKNQASCGSCWAFSTVAAYEGQYFKKNGKLVSFSEQQLVDCSSSFGNMGCNGGLMDNGFDYIKSIAPNGLDTEDSYAYEGRDGQCKADAGTQPNPQGEVTGHTDVPQGNEDALVNALASTGPVSVAIDASHMSFQFYSHGTYYESSCSSSQLDHGVTAIGYGTGDDGDYFIVKNSWGKGWGLDGYIHMARNRDNNCGIASSASFPILK